LSELTKQVTDQQTATAQASGDKNSSSLENLQQAYDQAKEKEATARQYLEEEEREMQSMQLIEQSDEWTAIQEPEVKKLVNQAIDEWNKAERQRDFALQQLNEAKADQ
jgi:hypothetical protein